MFYHNLQKTVWSKIFCCRYSVDKPYSLFYNQVKTTKEYRYMTEKEKMLAGELFYSPDEQLKEERLRANFSIGRIRHTKFNLFCIL